MKILEKAIQSAQTAENGFCKFITANDTGATGGHQAGFHIHKGIWPLFFDTPGKKGVNKDLFVTIKWQDDFETSSRFIYYGVGTRNEYRLTRFGRGFPFLTEDNVGDLLVLNKKGKEFFEGYVLSNDEDIEDFFASMRISSSETNQLFNEPSGKSSENLLSDCFNGFIETIGKRFPNTLEIANQARLCYQNSFGSTSRNVLKNSDYEIIKWLETEFELFKAIENQLYKEILSKNFSNVEELVKTANSILNRRKSRAGKSLEHHLEEIFKISKLKFQTQAVIEGNKKPDFLFPNASAYNDLEFNSDRLIFLASKTTCKDRWRQILNEADRIRVKHLFTLQQGISKNQLSEMKKYGVKLVVPHSYHSSFPKEYRSDIYSLQDFILNVSSIQITP
jgi:hypothetical protein